MIKKALLSMCIITIFLSMVVFPISAYSNTLIFQDDLDDVSGTDEDNISDKSDVDIDQIICEQDERDVTYSLKLNGGVFQESVLSIYIGGVVTTGTMYVIVLGEGDSGDYQCLIYSQDLLTYEENEIDGQCSGIGEETLTVTFRLLSSDEKCISAFATIIEGTTTDYYQDDYNAGIFESDFPVTITTDSDYSANVTESISFEASVDGGDSSDYNWDWIIADDDGDVVAKLSGQNVDKAFNIPGQYTGTVYSYDDAGNMGMEYFNIEILGSSTSGETGGDNDNPTSGLLFFAVLIIAIVIIGVAVVFFVLRR